MEVPIELCTNAHVFRSDPVRRAFLVTILIAIYAVSIPFCFYTAGEPRRIAMIQGQKLADEKWAREVNMNNTAAGLSAENGTAGEFVPIFFESEATVPSSQPVTATFGSIEDEFGNVGNADGSDGGSATKGKAAAGNWLASWFGPSIEQKRAKAEFEKWQKEFKEKSGNTVSLPPEYLPSAWACLALFATLSLHALFHLMCHWVVKFKALTLFKPADKVEEGCFVLIVPPANRGSASLVPIKKSTISGTNANRLYAEFQRQKYIYSASSKLGENAKKYKNGVFTLSAYPTNLPVSHYLAAHGIPSEGEISKLTEKWGKNHLAVAIPSFLELLRLQLLSPLAIFQVFCAILWLLDEYWTYTLFSLFSVVMYEATTVFQRTRTQQMLGGMAPKPSPIYAFRCGKWTLITTKDLLPGDLISLAFKKRADPNRPALLPNSAVVAAGPTTTGEATPPPAVGSNSSTTTATENQSDMKTSITSLDDTVPCDCLLLRGAAVVNEASLTGESVPQMKESLIRQGKPSTVGNDNDTTVLEDSERLDITGLHRVHTLFSGCSIVTVSARKKGDIANPETFVNDRLPPLPPDGGATAYVLRTGFGSSQGSLLQMIEFSQQTVSGDIKETGMALLILFVFALVASGYVLKEGLRKKEKTTHELLLKCVIIITSVVPRQFPMQMAVAVNMALMSLSKAGIFCTEPYRVPLAGKVTHCLFDKTGTITTDQLVPAGIINYNSSSRNVGEENAIVAGVADGKITSTAIPSLFSVTTACAETAMILAACHSLVVLDDDSADVPQSQQQLKLPSANLTGDPIELAAIKAIDWHWDGASNTASPDAAIRRHLYGLQIARSSLQKLQNTPADERASTYEKDVASVLQDITSLEAKVDQAKDKATSAMYNTIQVLQRHHFSSALQRMSVVVRCTNRSQTSGATVNSSSSSGSDHWHCLVKGSPEALRTLILPEHLPAWYSKTYEQLARRGLRVLALAYKKVSGKDRPQDQPRAWVESDLYFGGFIAFECKIRADSGIVIQSLLQSDHKVAMLTGDALLTSLHVAKSVGICSVNKANLVLFATTDGKFVWQFTELEQEKDLPFDVDSLPALEKNHNLLTIEENFLAAAAATGGKTSKLWSYARYFKVFARMSPQGKANIIRSIQEADKDFHVFMCGDGGNDVGALKQANVGLALLAGHANANTSEDLTKTPAAAMITNGSAPGTSSKETKVANAEDLLNAHEKKLQVRSEALNKLRAVHMKEFQARYTKEQQAILQEEIRKRTERGDYMSIFSLMKEQAGQVKNAMAAENTRFMAMHGQVWDPKKDQDFSSGSKTTGIASMLESLDGAESTGGLPMVRPGDASVAAPFTSRIPSIRAVVDLIRQGRCTLLSALMQQQIMMLESAISAYTLSSLSLHNARSSERQMMASSWLILTAAVSFSYASPVDHMHPLRPLRSLFNPAIFLSIMGQAAIHIACMTLAVQWATQAMGPEKLQEVTEFFRKAKAKEIDHAALCGEDDFMCQLQSYWTAPFMPNLLNSVVFLVETSQMISVFFANYKGRPWMKGLLENHPLFLSVFLCIGGVVVAAWEVVPQVNELIQLAPFPDDAFRYKVVALVCATILGTFLWDRICVFIFEPKVFAATVEEFKKTTLQDFYPILLTLGKVIAGICLLGTGNILLMGGAYYMYYSYNQRVKKEEEARILQG